MHYTQYSLNFDDEFFDWQKAANWVSHIQPNLYIFLKSKGTCGFSLINRFQWFIFIHWRNANEKKSWIFFIRFHFGSLPVWKTFVNLNIHRAAATKAFAARDLGHPRCHTETQLKSRVPAPAPISVQSSKRLPLCNFVKCKIRFNFNVS